MNLVRIKLVNFSLHTDKSKDGDVMLFDEIVISGSTGILGKNLTKKLRENGNEVLGLTRNKDDISKNKMLYEDFYSQYNDKKFILINCAFPRTNNHTVLSEGIDFTRKLISESLTKGCIGVINISSQSVYDQKDISIPNEKSKVKPNSSYGLTKYSVEILVEEMLNHTDIAFTNIRLASLMHPNFPLRIPNKFLDNIFNDLPITVSNGRQQISYLDVRDAAEALSILVHSDIQKWQKTYNLGDNHHYSLRHIIDLIGLNLGRTIDYQVTDEFSIFSNAINSNLFMEQFNWRPKLDIEDLIQEIINK